MAAPDRLTLPVWESPVLGEPPRPGPAPTSGPLIDTFGRVHRNVRISVTDKCNLRCTYCMPEEATFLPASALLSFDAIDRFTRVAASLGVTQVRLTGGEPLMRPRLSELVARVAHIPGVADLALTTNGLLLADQAARLRDAGLRRLNVSLDTLDPARFRQLARRDGLDRVLAGIDAALEAGFDSVKLNAVALRGVSEPDILPLARFARERHIEVRWIEVMPIGADPWDRTQLLSEAEIRATLERAFGPLRPVADADPHAPARVWEYPDGGRVGVIASVTRPFCRKCDRLRLTADGKLRNCLFALDESDARPALDAGDDAAIERAIRAAVWGKWEGHEINSARFVKPERTMHAIGG